MIDHTPTDDPVNKTVNIFRLYATVRNKMNVVRHYHVSEYEKFTGGPSLGDRIAGDLSNLIGAEYG